MVFIVRLPYWIFIGEVRGFIDQVKAISKAILNQVNQKQNEEDLPATFTELHNSVVPQMSNAYWVFCFAYLITNIIMVGVLWCLITMFNLHELTDFKLSNILSVIKDNIPSEGQCTLHEKDTGGVLREVEFKCIINLHHVYEWGTIAVISNVHLYSSL